MEEQEDTCGSTSESPQDKSPPDSPWSWVRTSVWPLRTVTSGRSADGAWGSFRPRGSHVGFVHSHFSKDVMDPATPQGLQRPHQQ